MMKRAPLSHAAFTLALCGTAIGLSAHSVAQTEAAKVAETTSYSDGSDDCRSVQLSPYADRETIAAALRGASEIVRVTGCVNVTLDPSFPLGSHAADMEG